MGNSATKQSQAAANQNVFLEQEIALLCWHVGQPSSTSITPFWWRRQLNLSNSLPTSSGIHKSLQVISRYTYPQQLLAIFHFISPRHSNSPDGWLIQHIYIHFMVRVFTTCCSSPCQLSGSVSGSWRSCVYATLLDKLFHTVFTWIALHLAEWLI